MIGLRDHGEVLDSEDPFRPRARVVGVAVGEVAHYFRCWYAVGHQVIRHRRRLVIVVGVVVTGNQMGTTARGASQQCGTRQATQYLARRLRMIDRLMRHGCEWCRRRLQAGAAVRWSGAVANKSVTAIWSKTGKDQNIDPQNPHTPPGRRWRSR